MDAYERGTLVVECDDVSVVAVDQNELVVLNGGEVLERHRRQPVEQTILLRQPNVPVAGRIQLYPERAKTMCDVVLRGGSKGVAYGSLSWPQ